MRTKRISILNADFDHINDRIRVPDPLVGNTPPVGRQQHVKQPGWLSNPMGSTPQWGKPAINGRGKI